MRYFEDLQQSPRKLDRLGFIQAHLVSPIQDYMEFLSLGVAIYHEQELPPVPTTPLPEIQPFLDDRDRVVYICECGMASIMSKQYDKTICMGCLAGWRSVASVD